MSYDEYKCPDRCDIEFTYDWNHTNLYLDFVKNDIKYMMNAGDTISIQLDVDKINLDKVSVISGNNSFDLEDKGNGLWEGAVPSSWVGKGIFSVVLQWGNSKALLYEGLLNYDILGVVANFGTKITFGDYTGNNDGFYRYIKSIDGEPVKVHSCRSAFSGWNLLKEGPKLDTSDVTNMANMFAFCSSLTSVPLFDTSNVTNMADMFNGCSSLTSVPAFNTSNVTNMSYMFLTCTSLTSVPAFDTSNVTNMVSMFSDCSSLTSVPLFDTSKVTDMYGMFMNCSSLTSVPLFDTSNVTSMGGMFNACTSLTSVPLFDTSKVTIMSNMFKYCTSLTSVSAFDTSNVMSMFGMFNGCSSLTSIPAFDTSNVTNMEYMFYNCSSLTAIHMRNIGASLTISNTALGHDALVELIGNLKSGVSNKTLTMGSEKLALLSDSEKKVATDRGWTLA